MMEKLPRDLVVAAALRQWQTRLLQLDRRNALLYFPVGRRGVHLTGLTPDNLLERLANSRKGLAFALATRLLAEQRGLFPAPDPESGSSRNVAEIPGDLTTDLPILELQKRLGALRARQREWQEEQGINVLFLAIGFLNWTDEEEVPARSPVLLVPCELTRQSPRDPFVLHRDESDDPAVNPTLRHKLRATFGIELTEFSEDTAAQYLAGVQSSVKNHRDWSVEPSVALAAFPYSKLAMWDDLQQMVSTGVTHPLVRRLAGDESSAPQATSTGQTAVPSGDRALKGARLDDLLNIRDQYTVRDADFSQLRAIEVARSGAHLVIHGPPGTGKSQTIANIIATLLAEGRYVLFVSEKTAALDVVKRRLTEDGLGSFCLDLHSDRGKKASVYAQLREALQQPRLDQREFPFDRLLEARDRLNATVRELHEVREPLRLSVFDVHGQLAVIADAPLITLKVRGIADMTAEHLRAIQLAAKRVALRPAQFRAHHTSPWRALGSVSPSPRLADTLRILLNSIGGAAEAVIVTAQEVSATCGTAFPESIAGVEGHARLLAHLGSAVSGVPKPWLSQAGLLRARAAHRSFASALAERENRHAKLREYLREVPPTPYPQDWVPQVRAAYGQSELWDKIAGPQSRVRFVAEPAAMDVEYRSVAAALSSLADAGRTLQALLGCPEQIDTADAAEAASLVAESLLLVGPVMTTWGTPRAIAEARSTANLGRKLSEELASIERALFSTFEPDVVGQVTKEMLARYRTDHRSVLRFLRSSYRDDQRALRVHLRTPKRLSLDVASAAVARALAVQRLRAEWEEWLPRFSSLLGSRFAGPATDWAAIDSDLNTLEALYLRYPERVSATHTCLTDPGARVTIAALSRRIREGYAGLSGTWPRLSDHPGASLCSLSEQCRALADSARTVASILDQAGAFVRLPSDLRELLGLLRIERELRAIETNELRARDERVDALGNFYCDWSTDPAAVARALEWAETLLELVGGQVPQEVSTHAQNPKPQALYTAAVASLRSSSSRIRAALAEGATLFPADRTPWGAWENAPLSELRDWAAGLRENADDASDWAEYRDATSTLDETVGGSATEAIRAVTDDALLVPISILRHILLAWLEHVFSVVPALQFAPRDLDAVRQEFCSLDAAFPRAARATVRAKCFERYPQAGGALLGLGELGVLNTELSKKRRLLPVRQLVAKIPNLLRNLKPCLMMSPLAVSQYLPRGATDAETLLFDAVIFDEASQVFPEDAVPSIARAQQVVVVGDRQQLPPSAFFRKGDADDYDDAAENEEAAVNKLTDVESILDVIVGMVGSGVEECYLQVHYRSKHDALIRYSNHYFYEDRLLTFPSSTSQGPGFGLSSVYLASGRFDSGGSKTNRQEADRVVEIVFDLMETRPPTESIGVVALSRSQADLIQSLVDRRRMLDRRFDERFDESRREPFFVKNLENVQGDERDHVLLSIGYGPTVQDGSVPNRFGPLNVEGGHRRLNVAVSRARRSMTVVHSLLPGQIHSEAQGARLLRRYLEFIRAGDASFEPAGDRAPGGDSESPFEDAVGRALEQRGYRIKRQVGCAKYWIDLAVLSEDGRSYDLGIECDGAAYHSSPSARDRDRLRQQVLEAMGWTIHRVWSTSWIRNARSELALIEKAVQQARVAPRPAQLPPQIPEAATFTDAESVSPTRTDPASRAPEDPPGALPSRLKPYVPADLSAYAGLGDAREASTSFLAELVVSVVRAEYPVHIDLVVERVSRCFGHKRAGRLIRESVEAAIALALRGNSIKRLGEGRRPGHGGGGAKFLMMPGGGIEPRGSMVNGDVRPIAYVCDEEIAAAVDEVLHQMIGATAGETVLATARALGYHRTGPNVSDRIRSVIDHSLSRGRIVETLGSLSVGLQPEPNGST